MADCVDRMKLLDALYAADAITMRGMEILRQIKAADVRPVVRGEWVFDCDRVMGDGWTYKQRHCSVCGWQTVECMNYCQNCGADMRKKEEELDER